MVHPFADMTKIYPINKMAIKFYYDVFTKREKQYD
jgi:hypothetical protein